MRLDKSINLLLLAATGHFPYHVNAAAAAATSSRNATYTLPPPTGKYHVGRTQQVIQHETRNDPLVPPGKKATSFLVNIWYPTLEGPDRNGNNKKPAKAYDYPMAKLYEDYFNQAYNISIGGILTGLTTDVLIDTPSILPEECGTIKLPTLIFQPPFVGPPSQCFTSLLSDLASRGYTVVTLDHPYEQPFIQYPHGGPGFYGPPITYDGNLTVVERYNAIRIADARALLDAWPDLVAKYHAQKVFNTTHFVALGHSIGGSASIGEVLELFRNTRTHSFIGGVNMDGSLFGRAGDDNSSAIDAKRPTLFMSSTREVDEGWTTFGTQQSAWFRYFEVDGTVHADYSDTVLWKQWFGVTTPGPDKIEATRMAHLVRVWIAGFIDKVTTGRRTTVVEGPSKEWPEVKLIASKN